MGKNLNLPLATMQRLCSAGEPGLKHNQTNVATCPKLAATI
jgi:hypothetical protein